jgi:hypothetical protein
MKKNLLRIRESLIKFGTFRFSIAVCLASLVSTGIHAASAEAPGGTGVKPWENEKFTHELTSQRTRTSKAFERLDGKISSFISPASIHYKNETGSWEEISNEIVANNGSVTHPYKNERNSIGTLFPQNPFSQYIIMKSAEGEVREKVKAIRFMGSAGNILGTLPVGTSVNALIDGNKIIYSGLHPQLQLQYSLGNDFRKFDLVILSSAFLSQLPAGTQYIGVEEEIVTAGGTTIRTTEQGLELLSGNVPVLGFSNPVAYSEAMPAQLVNGTFKVSEENGSYILTSRFATPWMQNASFPVHLDPTVNYYPQNVTFWTGYQTTSTGKTSGMLRITDATSASWAKFDISTLPSSAVVSAITYYGYHYSTNSGTKITSIRGMGNVDPVPATAAGIFAQATSGGPLYNNNYTFGTTTYQWNSALLGGTANADIVSSISQGWFGLGFTYVSGLTTFMYQYGINGTSLQYCYIEVVYTTTPCNGTPSANSIVSPTFQICPFEAAVLNLQDTYTVGGLTYQWYASSTSSVGPFTAIPNATAALVSIGGTTVTSWFSAVITCTNSISSLTVYGGQLIVQPTTTSLVPYYEGFEGIGVNNRLPNCSWLAPGLGSAAKTYTSAVGANLYANNGTSYATFSNVAAGTNYYYTNGIWLDANVTYSASMWYMSDMAGSANWTNLSIEYTSTQTPTALTQIASAAPAISPFYKSLSNTFTVASSGLYYIAIRATTSGGGAPNLTWDDLRIDIPCSVSMNIPLVGATANNTAICSGNAVILNASGANTYSWSTGATGQAITETPLISGLISVTGTSTLTGCSAVASVSISVKQSPIVNAFANPPRSCSGNQVNLVGSGASSYLWNVPASGAVVVVSPSITTTYMVVGTGSNGCTGSSAVTVTVDPLPVVDAVASGVQICKDDMLSLSGTGAVSYQWLGQSPPVLMQGQSFTLNLSVSTVFTMTGTDANGCAGTDIIAITVDPCTGLSTGNLLSGISVYPNPANDHFTVRNSSGNLISVALYDVSGRLIKHETGSGALRIDISEAAAGIYQLRADTDAGSVVYKLIKE